MFQMKKINSFILAMLLVVTTGSYVQAANLNVDADVVSVLTVTPITSLDFGQFATAGAGGDVTFDAATAITAAPDITLLGNEQGGVVTVSTSGAGNVTVTVVGTVLGGPGVDMPLVGNCQGPGGSLGTDNGSCTFAAPGAGLQTIDVGGVLTVNAGQASGAYSGTLDVTANFFP